MTQTISNFSQIFLELLPPLLLCGSLRKISSVLLDLNLSLGLSEIADLGCCLGEVGVVLNRADGFVF